MNFSPLGGASPSGGWRIERVPGRPLHPTEDGRFALPLWLVQDGRHVADAELIMSPAEAEHLHAGLCRALDSYPPPASGRGDAHPANPPYCRVPLGKSTLPSA